MSSLATFNQDEELFYYQYNMTIYHNNQTAVEIAKVGHNPCTVHAYMLLKSIFQNMTFDIHAKLITWLQETRLIVWQGLGSKLKTDLKFTTIASKTSISTWNITWTIYLHT